MTKLLLPYIPILKYKLLISTRDKYPQLLWILVITAWLWVVIWLSNPWLVWRRELQHPSLAQCHSHHGRSYVQPKDETEAYSQIHLYHHTQMLFTLNILSTTDQHISSDHNLIHSVLFMEYILNVMPFKKEKKGVKEIQLSIKIYSNSRQEICF